jgi:hypothetical protein
MCLGIGKKLPTITLYQVIKEYVIIGTVLRKKHAVSTQVKKHRLICSLCVDAAVAASQAWLSLLAKVF